MAKGTVESGALKVIKITANMSQHAWGVYCGPELSGSPYMDELTNPSHQPGERERLSYLLFPILQVRKLSHRGIRNTPEVTQMGGCRTSCPAQN